MGRSKRAIVRFFAIRTLGKFLGPPLRRSPALVCDCFLNIRKRALDRPEKLHLSFRLSALVAARQRFCERAALRHQLLAGLFQICNVICRHTESLQRLIFPRHVGGLRAERQRRQRSRQPTALGHWRVGQRPSAKIKLARSGLVLMVPGSGSESESVQPTPRPGGPGHRLPPAAPGPFCSMRGRSGCDLRHNSTALSFRSSIIATATGDAQSLLTAVPRSFKPDPIVPDRL